MSTPLVDFWAREFGIYEGSPAGDLNGLRPRAEQAMNQARAGLDTARTSKQQASDDVAATQQKITALRAKMANDDPADVESDAAQLRTLIGTLRTAAGRVVFYSDMILKCEADIARATVERDRCLARSVEAAAALDAAQERQDTLAGWLDPTDPTKLDASLAAVPATASAKLDPTAPERKAAEDRIALYFPTSPNGDLQGAVAARQALHVRIFDDSTGLLQVAANAAAVALDAQLNKPESGLAGKVESARTVYENAWSALETFARTANDELARALSLFGVAASLPEPPASLAASITTGSYHDAAAPSLAKEVDRNTKVYTVLDAITALLRAALTAGAADPVALDPAVVQKYQDLQAATTMAAAGELDFVTNDKPKIDAWEAALPDDPWKGWVALQEAIATLTRLRRLVTAPMTPHTLVANLSTAEANLVTALGNAAAADRVTAFLRDTVAQRSGWVDRAGEVRLDHLFSAARGDA